MAKLRSTHKKGFAKQRNTPANPRMNWNTVPPRVRELAEPLCHAEGLELVHVECIPGPRGRILRIFLDKPGGIQLDDCVAMSRVLSDLLDIELNIPAHYHLEVSSPGPERPLSQPADFERFAGERVRIQTRKPLEGQKNFTGLLQGQSQDKIQLVVEGRQLEIPLDGILRARLAPQ